MTYILGEQPTKALNITLRKGQFHRLKLRSSNLGAYGVNELAWWGQYVRDGETGEVIAENSKDTEDASGITTWVFSTLTAEAEIYIYYYEDFYENIPSGTLAYQHDIVFIDTAGRIHVEAAGTFTFLPRYTRDHDTESQVRQNADSWTDDLCEALADQRTALLAIPETGTLVSGAHAADADTITIQGGSPTTVFLVGDDIGIELDAGGYHETTVDEVVSALEYGLADHLPSAAANGNGVYKGKCNHVRCGTA